MKNIFLSLLAFLLMSFTQGVWAFTDVAESDTSYAAIKSLENLKIITGYPDGSFKPEQTVIRVEALKMILLSAEVEVAETVEESGFPDAEAGAWFSPYSWKAKEAGIVKGDGDTGNLAPARTVITAEFLKMMLEAFQTDISKHQNLTEPVAPDVPADAWFSPYFSYAMTLGIISPKLDGSLEPDKPLTRRDCAEILYRMLLIIRGGDTQKMLSAAEAKLVTVLVDLNKDDIESALSDANSAVFYAEQALNMAPEEGIVRAAEKISKGFLELCLGYKAGLDGDYQALLEHADNADELAGLAYVDTPSTQPLGQQIKAQSAILRAQIPTEGTEREGESQ